MLEGDDWTLLAPGTSLDRALAAATPPRGPVVAINQAVTASVRPDFWCAQDHPRAFEHIWGPMTREERARGPVIWCRRGKLGEEWERLGFRTWKHPEGEDDFLRELFPRAEFGVSFILTSLTIFAALARIISYHPRSITTFGVDMAGYGYVGDLPDRQKRDRNSWADRWRSERQQWEALEKAIAPLAIRIERRIAP